MGAACAGKAAGPSAASPTAPPASALQAPAEAKLVRPPCRYAPATASEAFANHMAASATKDMDRLLMDYAETSRMRVYVGNTGEFNEYVGLANIRELYTGLLEDLGDASDVKALIQGREDNMCFCAWESPAHGYTRCFDTFVYELTEDGWKTKFHNVTGSKDSVPDAAARPLVPTSAAGALENYMAAMAAKDMDRLLADYTETSRLRAYVGNTGEFNEYVGLAGVREFYAGLWEDLGDMSDLRAPIQVREDNMCFFAWEAPSFGYTRGMDTIVYELTDGEWKTTFHNTTFSRDRRGM